MWKLQNLCGANLENGLSLYKENLGKRDSGAQLLVEFNDLSGLS